MSQKGLLERSGLRITEEDGESLKKSVDAQKALLDSIGTSSSTKTLGQQMADNWVKQMSGE